ncbi:MAG: rhodanese-like domain-containing protein [Cryobacterium sp.]
MKKILITLTLAVTAAIGLSACSAPEPIALSADTTVLDVRTAGEFDAGHLDGAVNIDVQSADFDALVAELEPDADYVVYCASGNRSGAAIDRMTGLGFTDLTDAGGLGEAGESLGLPTVTGP